jgi:predicted acyl esterase
MRLLLGCFVLLSTGAVLHCARALAQAQEVTNFAQRTKWARMRDGELPATKAYLPKDAHEPLPVVDQIEQLH